MPLPSDLYDREYFLSEKCEGFDRFQRDRGLSRLKRRELEILAPWRGEAMLDAGCGRGEVLLAASQLGTSVAGIDYSEAAVEIANETLAGISGADVRRGDVTDLPWPEGSFDLVLFGDVIEHLDSDQAAAALAELKRVLRTGGRLLIHTAPNILFLWFGLPVVRIGMAAIGKRQAVSELDDWIAESKRYHVNEQSVFSLRKAVRSAGFADVRAWIDPDVVRSGEHHLTESVAGAGIAALGARLAASRPLRTFLGNDLYATGRRP